MSSPSRSVRLARTASPSPGRASPIVTPGKKIKAMLSAFDDSDSDEPSRDISANKPSNDASKTHPGDEDASASESEEEDIVKPRGRMAARMQMQGQQARNGCNDGETETAFERVSRMMREEREKEKEVQQQKSGQDASGKSFEEDEDEDLPTAGRRRRPNHAERSPSRERSFSPLFMSSPTATRQNEADSDDAHNEADSDDAHNEEDSDAHPSVRPKSNDRFLALVAQKRKEREEKERAEAEKKANRAKQMEQFSSEVHSGEDSGDDAGSGRKFTQQSRPARKASKKALEEMHRETQRMSRNMQLTHQMQTKKKITKESLFAKFNFMQPGPNARAESSSVTAESQPSSDIEQNKRGGTPMTSPLLEPEKETSVEKQPLAQTKAAGDGEANPAEDIPEDLPSLDQLLSQPQEQPEVTVGRAEIQTNQQPSDPRQGQRESLTKAPVRVRLSRKSIAQHQKEDSDDDLEVITSPGRCRSIAAFENLPSRRAQEPVSMTRWKALAHLTSPTRRAATMNAAELSASLLQRAKQQAAKERKERIQELKDKGIIIETAEERAAMEDTVEDLMERARKEGEAIAKREKASKKKGEPDDEDEDDDYEVSGSEEERVDEDEDEGEGEADGEDGFIENEANEADESEGDERDEGDESEATSESEAEPAPRRKRPTRVVSDDEDDEPEPEPKTPAKQTTQIFGSAERPQFPDLPGSNGLTMSLTQAFAGTLGDTRGTQEEPTIPNSLPDPGPSNVQDSDPQVIKDSQEHQNQTTDLFAGYTQSDARVSESPAFRQFSQIPEPTQDAGFVLSPFDPSKRFMGTPTSTIETVLVGQNESQNSPQKRNRPLKRGQAPRLSVVEEDDGTSTAFDVMKKSAKPESTPFDKKKSKAKDVVEEAAEESDDEYAGLGGGSDDSEDEEDGYDQQMINDFSGEKVDEKQLAALNAVHHRATDEKQVAKLLKDITTGALRRRRGADDEFDLDDSDDERLARRREKQREFARMRKALLADEKVGEIAENPKKAAFFKAIEDRDSDDEIGLDFLDEPGSGSQEDTSQEVQVPSEAQQHPPASASGPDSNSNKRKRPLEPSAEDINNRPPPHLRRKPASAMSKKPANLAEIRETVSFLTETPEYDSFREAASVDEQDEQDLDLDPESEEQQQPSGDDHFRDNRFTTTFTHPRRTRGPVIDRLALLRQASSNSTTPGSANTKLAFHNGSNDVGFRPSFARRATGSSSSTSLSSTSTSTSDSSRRVSKIAAAPAGGSVAKRGAVNYYTAAREKERERELRVKQRSSGRNIAALLNKHASNSLSSLGGGEWE